MSAVALFGFLAFPVTIFVTVLVTRLVSIFVSALGGLGFLFFIHTVCSMLASYGAAVHCDGVAVQLTIGKDGFPNLIRHQ